MRRSLVPFLMSSLLVGMPILLGLGCKRPETAFRERPVQAIELVQAVPGMTPAEEQALVAQLTEGLGVTAAAPGTGPIRIFRLTLKGAPNLHAQRGLGTSMLVSTGTGALIGLLAPALGFTFWTTVESAAIATGAGGLLGLAYGPIWHWDNQALVKEKGYLPWTFTAEWEVLERGPANPEQTVASSDHGPAAPGGRHAPRLDLRPFLQTLPEDRRSEAEIRQASLKAYGQALITRFKTRG